MSRAGKGWKVPVSVSGSIDPDLGLISGVQFRIVHLTSIWVSDQNILTGVSKLLWNATVWRFHCSQNPCSMQAVGWRSSCSVSTFSQILSHTNTLYFAHRQPNTSVRLGRHVSWDQVHINTLALFTFPKSALEVRPMNVHKHLYLCKRKRPCSKHQNLATSYRKKGLLLRHSKAPALDYIQL